jgi:hypothetical protein
LLDRINNLETALESQIAELRENITKLEGEISQVKTALKDSQDKIIELETDLESQKSEIRENIAKLKKATWWIWAAIAAIISALIAGGVAVHRSRKDTKIKKRNQAPKDPKSTDKLPDKETLLDPSNKDLGSISKHEYTGLGLLGHWLSWIRDTRFPREVRNDWLRVEAMHRRIVERISPEAADPKCKSEDKADAEDKSEAKADTEDKPEAKVDPKDNSEDKSDTEDKLTLREKRKLLDRSHDCLCFAMTTHLLEDAWRHLNLASETLSIIVEDEEECAELAERFEEWEPLLDRHLKNMYGKPLAQEFEKHRNAAQDSRAKIRTHSRQWALINQANSFRIRMSRRIAILFLVSSTVMLWTTLHIIKYPDSLTIYAPLYIFIYGWFGAALSILLAARKLKPSAVTFRTLCLNLLLRLALGAGGALVTFVVVCTPGLLDDTLGVQFQKIPGFIALGIAGGFSERLFRRVLEMFTKRIVPPKPDEDSEQDDSSKE